MGSRGLKAAAYNALAVAVFAALVTLPLLPEVQAGASWLAYYAAIPYAKLPAATLIVTVAARGAGGAPVPVEELAIVWLASPRNNFTSSLVHKGRGASALLQLPRVHLGRASAVDAYNRVRWIDFYNVENLLVMVSSNGHFGATVVGVELTDPIVNLKVEVNVTSTLPPAPRGAEWFAQSSSWYSLVEWQEVERLSAFATLHPDAGVKIAMVVPQGKALWFESRSRAAPSYESLPKAQWSVGNSGVNSPVTTSFDTSVPAPSGGLWIKLGTKVRWRYERWEKYENGVLVQVIEAVFPSACLGGAYYLDYGSYSPPAVSGNVKPIGDPGACVQFDLGGVWQFGDVSATVGFSVTYPNDGSVTIGFNPRFVIRYVGCTVTVCVTSAARDPLKYSVVAFDGGTSWGEVYTAWVPD